MTPTSRGTSGGASGSTWGSKGGDEIVHGNVGNLGHSATEGKGLSAEKRPSRACIAEMLNAGCSCRGSYTQKYYSVASVFEMARLTRRATQEKTAKNFAKNASSTALPRARACARAPALFLQRERRICISYRVHPAQLSAVASSLSLILFLYLKGGREGRGGAEEDSEVEKRVAMLRLVGDVVDVANNVVSLSCTSGGVGFRKLKEDLSRAPFHFHLRASIPPLPSSVSRSVKII